MRSVFKLALLCAAAAFPLIMVVVAQEPEARVPQDPMSTPTFNDLRLRLIGPAFTSGRVSALAVDPANRSRFFVAAASGGVPPGHRRRMTTWASSQRTGGAGRAPRASARKIGRAHV